MTGSSRSRLPASANSLPIPRAEPVVIFPAIDIRNGRVVRLAQGEASRETAYRDDPIDQAEEFIRQGASWIHVVDLDRAFGTGDNLETVIALSRQVGSRVQLQVGGGLRTLPAMEGVLEHGVTRAVLGTVAVDDPSLVRQAVSRFGPERFAAGLDTRGGMVATRGWVHTTGIAAHNACRRLLDDGIRTIIYTDVARDGMLGGPDVEGAVRLAGLGAAVVVSGGVGRLEEIREVARAGLAGVIVGRALYEKRFTLGEAILAAIP
jgi:phosphoribosylformimino-5-aminoimidazole carboxamide ribotide isomerase